MKCSSDESWSMICFCMKSSFTTMLRSNLELILILLSLILISNWQSEFAKTLTSVSRLDIKLYVNHCSEKNKLLLKDCLLFQDWKKIETDENEINVTVTTLIKEQKWLVMLTESKSYKTHVKYIIINQKDVWNEINKSKRRVTLYDSWTCWNWILRNEFHMKKSRDSKHFTSIQMLYALRTVNLFKHIFWDLIRQFRSLCEDSEALWWMKEWTHFKVKQFRESAVIKQINVQCIKT